jgi:hypothetical protein
VVIAALFTVSSVVGCMVNVMVSVLSVKLLKNAPELFPFHQRAAGEVESENWLV